MYYSITHSNHFNIRFINGSFVSFTISVAQEYKDLKTGCQSLHTFITLHVVQHQIRNQSNQAQDLRARPSHVELRAITFNSNTVLQPLLTVSDVSHVTMSKKIMTIQSVY